ncbi:MAG: hypothetical protein IJ655_06210 [Lachnospiraceae bacterium]|nr:hypothetical protein [Lachnospiraceae bacterium]
MNTITIDCGASFLKGAIFEDNCLIKTVIGSSPIVHKNEPITDTIQIDELVRNVEAMIIELSDGLDGFKLCMSNEMHGFLLSDEKYNPLTDYISWQKEYGNIMVDGATSKEYFCNNTSEDARLKTGMPVRAGLPSCNLTYLVRNGIIGESINVIKFWTLGDYVLSRIFKCDMKCHLSNAAATGLLDLTTGKWNDELINVAGLRNIVFPEIGDSSIMVNWNQKDVIVCPAIGDQQAALLGSDFVRANDLSYNLGTGSQVSVITDTLELSNDYQIRPYFDGKYIKTVPHIPSGRALNVYIRFIENILLEFGCDVDSDEIWKVVIANASECQHSNLKIDMSFFENPLSEKNVGSIDNIGEYDLTLSSLMAGVFESMSDNYIRALFKIGVAEISFNRVIFSGGVARKNRLLRELILGKMNYDGIVLVAENETMLGLKKYGELIK